MVALQNIKQLAQMPQGGTTVRQPVQGEADRLFAEFSNVLDRISSALRKPHYGTALSDYMPEMETSALLPSVVMTQTPKASSNRVSTLDESDRSIQEEQVLYSEDEEPVVLSGVENVISEERERELNDQPSEQLILERAGVDSSQLSRIGAEVVAAQVQPTATNSPLEPLEEAAVSEEALIEQVPTQFESAGDGSASPHTNATGRSVSSQGDLTERQGYGSSHAAKTTTYSAEQEEALEFSESSVAASSPESRESREVEPFSIHTRSKQEVASASLSTTPLMQNISAAVASVLERATQATIQSGATLKGSTQELSIQSLGDKRGITQSGAVDSSVVRTSREATRGEERARPVVRAQIASQLEKVENALKEVAKSKDGKTISVRLDPPDLGTVKVDVTIKDGGLHARLMAESSQVVSVLKERAGDLQQALRKLGLDVDTVTVAVVSEESFVGNQMMNSNQDQREQAPSARHEEASGARDGGAIATPVVRESELVLDHWVA
jgi:flagellar hook-length control protein FliK